MAGQCDGFNTKLLLFGLILGVFICNVYITQKGLPTQTLQVRSSAPAPRAYGSVLSAAHVAQDRISLGNCGRKRLKQSFGSYGIWGLAEGALDEAPVPFQSLANAVTTHPHAKGHSAFVKSRSHSWNIRRYGRVCIVAQRFPAVLAASLTESALAALADHLSSSGFEVTLLATAPDPATHDATHTFWEANEIIYVVLPASRMHYDVSAPVSTSHRVYEWLKEQDPFDVVHFDGAGGTGFFSVQGKHQGIAFARSRFVVHQLAPSLWAQEVALEPQPGEGALEQNWMECRTLQLADMHVSPSSYMLSWLTNACGQLARNDSIVQPPVLPKWLRKRFVQRAASISGHIVPKEIVFLGELSIAKGLINFCDALDQIWRSPELRSLLGSVEVTFLGRRPPLSPGIHMKGGQVLSPQAYIAQRAAAWQLRVEVLDQLDFPSTMDYVTGPGARVVVMPSLAENYHVELLACIMLHVPFIASGGGGLAEQLPGVDTWLIEPNSKALMIKLAEALKQGVPTLRSFSISPYDDADDEWLVWHHMAVHDMSSIFGGSGVTTPQLTQQPMISVCMVTFNNEGPLLQQALDSLEAQTYPNFEVILVDDGSTDAAARAHLQIVEARFAVKGWKVLRNENSGPGASRNLAARQARGEWLFFMDDDNVAKRLELTTFMAAAQATGADVLTTSNDYFSGDAAPSEGSRPEGRWVPLGAAYEVGVFHNVYGDTNAVIRKCVFDAIGGFPEDFGYAMEDHEMFSKAVLAGYHLVAIPEPLYWYRIREHSWSRVTAPFYNNMRMLRPYLKSTPHSMHRMLVLAQGMRTVLVQQGELDVTGSGASSQAPVPASTAAASTPLHALAGAVAGLCEQGDLEDEGRNLLNNANFHFQAPRGPDGALAKYWDPYMDGYTHSATMGRVSGSSFDRSAIRVERDSAAGSSGAQQHVILNQQVAADVVISGWSKADRVVGTSKDGYSIFVDVNYVDGSHHWGWYLPFDKGTHDWQFQSAILHLDQPAASLQVYAMFRGHTGIALFDDIVAITLKDSICAYSKTLLDAAPAG